ncbi:Nucleolar protein 12 [Mycoemilia scoparia]|uniref:Nucleolar protein 12 n=1 Tax=Mycoemilia scoparia TaxID=417184 RepID=A0A9W8A2H8_9FUNG|nr:Nucleolar protein 12 [Mycoemilia scoparia]
MSGYKEGDLSSVLLGGSFGGDKGKTVDTELDGLFKVAAAAPEAPKPMVFKKRENKNETQTQDKKKADELTQKEINQRNRDRRLRKAGKLDKNNKDSDNTKSLSNKRQRSSDENDEGDDDSNAQTKKPKKPIPEDPERKKRTVFIGNLSTEAITNKKVYVALKKKLEAYGKVETIRFRSIAFAKLLSRKEAFISKQIHSERQTCNAYIVFENKEQANKCLELNGTLFLEKHIRVDIASNDQKHDPKRSVFVGNIAFDTEEEDLWSHFATCGTVENVRLIRDPTTNLGKGFGYVLFKDIASVSLALKLGGTKIGDRKVRVSRCTKETKKDKLSDSRPKKFKPRVIEGTRAYKGDKIGKLGKKKIAGPKKPKTKS